MATTVGGRSYPARVWLVALFVLFALFLGGGGSPNPVTEMLLELVFAAVAVGWLWLPGVASRDGGRVDPLVLVLIAIPLAIPLVQLVPLPPSAWTALPARHGEVASLALVGQENSWRPISLSSSRTLAAVLAILPAVGCTYAVARMSGRQRRLILVAIVLMAVASSMLGAMQLVAGSRGINLYGQFHAGWVTGFQANRNAEADVLLIGFMALVVLVAPYLADRSRRFPLDFDRRAVLALAAGLALFLLAATAMTGSRAGTALIAVALVFAGAMLWTALAARRDGGRGMGPVLIGVTILAVALLAVVALYSNDTALARVVARFSDTPDGRPHLWQDAWFALRQYWPVGFGVGGFEPAMIPAERLEFLDATIPNRAHNDFLELGLEAGLPGYLMLAAAALVCLAMAWKSWQDRPAMRTQVVFVAGVLIVITLHSFVDYPLRSMALACLAGVAGGMLARPAGTTGASDARDGRNKVEFPA
jgi:O-antigen ligase